MADGVRKRSVDIVIWLRSQASLGGPRAERLNEAADEIERRRREVEILVSIANVLWQAWPHCDHPWHRNPALLVACPECGDTLPELTAEDRAALNSLGPDFIKRLIAMVDAEKGDTHVFRR